jgi:hypothetical protein
MIVISCFQENFIGRETVLKRSCNQIVQNEDWYANKRVEKKPESKLRYRAEGLPLFILLFQRPAFGHAGFEPRLARFT